MKKYLTKFDTASDYNSFIEGSTKEYVNVSYIVDDDEVKYWKIDYSKMYLTFEVVEAGTITIKELQNGNSVTIQYSTDNGQNWTSLTTSTTEQSLGNFSIGDKVMIKSTNKQWGQSNNYNYFGGTAKVNVYGNIMSLLYGDDFIVQTTLTNNYSFNELFYGYNNLISAENLILPAITLTSRCYYGMFYNCTSLVKAPKILPATTLVSECYTYMFYGCTSLTTAPELPAATLVYLCYAYMFQNCSSLNYIKCLATDISTTTCIINWTNGVASTGTFVKDASMTSWSSGASGIPDNWTIQNA